MKDTTLYAVSQAKEAMMGFRPAQAAASAVCAGLFYFQMARQNPWHALVLLLRAQWELAAHGKQLPGYAQRSLDGLLNRLMTQPFFLIDSYRKSGLSHVWHNLFSRFDADHRVRLKYPKEVEEKGRQGDLLVLKPWISEREKGVLLVQYDESVCKMASVFDLQWLARRYRIVVEPSTCGYQNPFFFLLYGLETSVLFESQYRRDYDYIKGLGGNFHTSRLGAGDWVDSSLFMPGMEEEKRYDLVMVANWLSFKRHRLLFRSLAPIRDKIGKIALVGYPAGGRTKENIMDEARQYNVADKLEIFEKVPPAQVAEVIRSSRFGLLLSRKEGANRGIYECFFSNVPIILSASNMGVNRDHVNEKTGMVVEDQGLTEGLLRMREGYAAFTPRAWAEKNTGYVNATRMLNEQLRWIALTEGEEWSHDIFTKKNMPTAMYALEAEAAEADREYERMKVTLLEPR